MRAGTLLHLVLFGPVTCLPSCLVSVGQSLIAKTEYIAHDILVCRCKAHFPKVICWEDLDVHSGCDSRHSNVQLTMGGHRYRQIHSYVWYCLTL
jgi:uncharacterized protein YcgI (DUF1989 family)